MSWIDGTRARLRLLFGRRDAEARMDEEMRFHLEMETERIARQAGVGPREARRCSLGARSSGVTWTPPPRWGRLAARSGFSPPRR